MKKIYLYISLCLFMAGLIISCADNTNFSNLHELTADEIAEIARQDSIREAQKNKINADLVLKYSVEITTSKTLYDGVSLPISIDSIARLFSLSNAQVLAGIAGESGAPEIKPFAIEGTTHADNGTASTTNSTWGHWWDANGDVTTWGSSEKKATLFAEFDTEAGEFYVGQYPNRLEANDTIKIIECLKYNEKRVAVVITVKTVAPGQINATVVSTQNLSISIVGKSSYDPDSLQFDLNKALSDLGVSSMNEVKFLGVNQDGSYAQEAVTGNGFWYDMNGFVGSWGNDASVYTNYGDFAANYISIGQYPDHLTEGQKFTIKYCLWSKANKKIVVLNIAITVVGYQDPETPPTGDPVAVEKTIELSKTYSNDYASVQVDVKDLLRNAFKKTTYQIHKAISSGELKLYQGTVSETAPTYTADAPGYWLKADGTAGPWSESLVWCSLGHSETELYLYSGNHPDNCVPGTTVTTKLIATYNGGSVTFNVTIKVN